MHGETLKNLDVFDGTITDFFLCINGLNAGERIGYPICPATGQHSISHT